MAIFNSYVTNYQRVAPPSVDLRAIFSAAPQLRHSQVLGFRQDFRSKIFTKTAIPKSQGIPRISPQRAFQKGTGGRAQAILADTNNRIYVWSMYNLYVKSKSMSMFPLMPSSTNIPLSDTISVQLFIPAKKRDCLPPLIFPQDVFFFLGGSLPEFSSAPDF